MSWKNDTVIGFVVDEARHLVEGVQCSCGSCQQRLGLGQVILTFFLSGWDFGLDDGDLWKARTTQPSERGKHFPSFQAAREKTHESRLTFWASTSAAFLLLLTFSVCSPIFAIRASMFCFFKVSWASCDANLALRSSTWIGGKKEVTQILPSLSLCMCVAFNGGEKWQPRSLVFLHWPCG